MTAPVAHKIEVRREQREHGAVVHVVYDYSRRLNVLNPSALRDLADTFHSLAKDEDLRVVVFSGVGGKAFIGGADINHMAALREGEEGRAFITLIHKLCQAIRDCPVPVICRLEGYTLGAGLEVAVACDMRIAAETAFFGMPEVKVGVPSVVEAALLPRLIGWGRTSRLLLTAETIGAAKAEAWGLVEEVVPAAELDAAIERCVGAIVEATPKAVRSQKRLMRRWERLPLDEAVQAGIDAFAQSIAEGEHIEPMGNFVRRKKAQNS
ncbi:Enoyl-CoA hydratase/carnithine racemase [Enhydrobacter aerosaccus]|uniref:Enoyl-CoA hydratase/carnithine racemase n=1 Tax=Enhydrobacter aerosaccus TaxID=225324 RepID=A0A1T4MNQ6_9HYPH|nr:enoyl-CoA hydratase [Enhydrobacter aerosaccus]SJZ68642.1 Enoyl-CoA hydratase/carnithine racemase [Enhydrobacter aerosaccus]